MRTGSLRRRTLIATLAVLVTTLGAFATVVTVRYRDGPRWQARSQLLAGAQAMRLAADPMSLKSLIGSLALDGIDVQWEGNPTGGKGGAPADGSGQLLTDTVTVHGNGSVQHATLSSSEASTDEAVNRLIVIELIGAALVLVVASVLTWLALRSALAPLCHVAAVAQRIARGERHERLRPQHPNTELGQIAASLDAMVDSLGAAVTQAMQSESAMRLGQLVDDLLDLARLQANEPLRVEPVDLVAVSDDLTADARQRTFALIALVHDGPATVAGDPDALARAIRNLLDNAIRASGEHGQVRVEIQRSGARVRLSVSDNGPGVPPAERERIFDGFVRLNGSSGHGTGIGLAIARAIVRQHRGEITCEDTAYGARFAFELPGNEDLFTTARWRSQAQTRANDPHQ